MITTSLQGITELVIKRAQQNGSLAASEVREELARAGVEAGMWKDVIALASPSLRYRKGRYHYHVPVSDSLRREQNVQRDVQRAVRQLARGYRAAAGRFERRESDRVDFIQPVQVVTEDQKRFRLLSRDLSSTGIRLIGTRRLLGQKVRVVIPQAMGGQSTTFVVRILWTCAVGDDLFENGGTFLGVDPSVATV